MKKTHYILLIAHSLFLATPSVFGQQCRDYACVIAKVEKLMKQNQKDYKVIMDNLESAEGYPDSKAEQIRGLRRRVFVLIENEKNEAKRARDEAKKQTDIAQKAFAQVEIEKEMVIAEKTKTQAAESKAKAVLDKIYFYDDKFCLASQKNQFRQTQYGFIDRDLNTKINFKYDEALPFDYTGFAKVRKGNVYYLVDTIGIEYKLGLDISQSDTSITALDLRNKKIKEIPPSVLEYIQLEILILGNNQLSSLPTELFKLTKLTNLNLNRNQLNNLPTEFGQLTKLTNLNLNGNQLGSLPTEFGQLINLTSLNISFNQLNSLPTEFGQLFNLTNLNLNVNQLSSLPSEFGQLTNLTILNLNGNQLSSLPPEFRKLTNLTSLDLRDNPIIQAEQEKIKKLLPKCKIIF
jgi:hypothetical protein